MVASVYYRLSVFNKTSPSGKKLVPIIFSLKNYPIKHILWLLLFSSNSMHISEILDNPFPGNFRPG